MGTGDIQALTSPLGSHRHSLAPLAQGCPYRLQTGLPKLACRPSPLHPRHRERCPGQHPGLPHSASPGGPWGQVPRHFGQSSAMAPAPRQGSPQQWVSLHTLHSAAQGSRSPSPGHGQHPAGRGYLPRAHSSHTTASLPPPARSLHPTSRPRRAKGRVPPRSARGAHGKGPEAVGKGGQGPLGGCRALRGGGTAAE